jgi:16S rRNA (guanine527-N7)-methyltransferase
MNPELFVQELKAQKIKLNNQQQEQFAEYYRALIAANEHVNLTRITAEDEVYLKHFYDSLTPLLAFPDLFAGKKSLCDVGAGAGFPSVPMRLIKPDLSVTIVDSLGKRLKFLADLLAKLDVADLKLVHARAEDAGRNAAYREQFDLVTARAVANLPVLSEYCLPLVKKNGYLIALKGPKAQTEIEAAQKAIKVLGGQVTAAQELTLPHSSEERTLVVIKKVKPTPKKYPRQAGIPRRKPIK